MPVLDQQQTQYPVVFMGIYGNNIVAQTFQAGKSGALKTVKLWCQKYGTPPDDLTIEIQGISGGYPDGNVLATEDLSQALFGGSPGSEITVTFASPMTKVLGTSYAIVLKSPSSDSLNCYACYGDRYNNLYANGKLCYDTGVGWGDALGGTADAYFKTYKEFIVTTNSASNVSVLTATLNGTLSYLEEGETVEVWFEYWKNESGASVYETSKQELNEDGSFSANISGLEAGVEYKFKAIAQSTESGSSEIEGSEVTFTTVTIDIRNLSAVQITEGDDKGKVRVTFEIISISSPVTINDFEYDIGEGWENITTYSPSSFELESGELETWQEVETIWDADTDLADGEYTASIRIKINN